MAAKSESRKQREAKQKIKENKRKREPAHLQGIGMDLNTPIRSNTTPLSSSVFKSKLIFLHEWWLMKPQNQCNGLALAGIASMERERMFFSSMIVKRHEPNVVETEDGVTIIIRGFINSSRTSQNGFPSDVIHNALNLKLQVIAPNTLNPSTIKEVCRRFSVGFPHNWKNYSADSSGNECQYVDKVTGFDDSNAFSHKKTADEISHEAMEAEDNDNIASIRLSQPQVGVAYNGENRVSDVDDLNPCHKKKADVTSQEAMEAEDNNNIGGLRLSQPQVDLINNSENGVSIAAAAESNQSLMGVFEFDPIHEQSNVTSPLYPKKLEFEQLSSDRKEKKRIKKIVEDTSSLCSRVLTRSIAKKSHMMLKRDGKAEVKCSSCPVRRSPRVHNYKNK